MPGAGFQSLVSQVGRDSPFPLPNAPMEVGCFPKSSARSLGYLPSTSPVSSLRRKTVIRGKTLPSLIKMSGVAHRVGRHLPGRRHAVAALKAGRSVPDPNLQQAKEKRHLSRYFAARHVRKRTDCSPYLAGTWVSAVCGLHRIVAACLPRSGHQSLTEENRSASPTWSTPLPLPLPRTIELTLCSEVQQYNTNTHLNGGAEC